MPEVGLVLFTSIAEKGDEEMGFIRKLVGYFFLFWGWLILNYAVTQGL
jgi:hypothetical protein